MTDQIVADARATLALLDEKGWAQGQWCAIREEGDGSQWQPDKGQFCLGGAMAYVISGRRTPAPNQLLWAERERFLALTRAMDLPVEHYDTREDSSPYWVVTYNDTVAQTVDDVKAILSATIERLEGQP